MSLRRVSTDTGVLVVRGTAIFPEGDGDIQGRVTFTSLSGGASSSSGGASSSASSSWKFRVFVSLTSTKIYGKEVGMHVHGDASGVRQVYRPDLPHYDPYKTDLHGLPGVTDAKDHHLGDLGNIRFNDDGVCSMEKTIEAPLFGSLSMPLSSIAGKILVIHGCRDDGGDEMNGHSGEHVAYATVKGYDSISIRAACPRPFTGLPIGREDAYREGCNMYTITDGDDVPLTIESVPVYSPNKSPHIHIVRDISKTVYRPN